jgi:hypothetical protein
MHHTTDVSAPWSRCLGGEISENKGIKPNTSRYKLKFFMNICPTLPLGGRDAVTISKVFVETIFLCATQIKPATPLATLIRPIRWPSAKSAITLRYLTHHVIRTTSPLRQPFHQMLKRIYFITPRKNSIMTFGQ